MAIADFDTTIVLDNNLLFVDYCFSDVYKNRGLARSMLQQYELAIQDYSRAIKSSKKYGNTGRVTDQMLYYNRASCYGQLGEYQLELQDYNKAISLDPQYAKAYFNRGQAKYDLGLEYCLDFKKACQLGIKQGCSSFWGCD